MTIGEDALTIALGGASVSIPNLYVLLFLLVLTVGACALLYVTRLRPAKRKTCRWRRDRGTRRGPFTHWHCSACGEDAYSADRRPPKECKRPLKSVI